MQSSPPIPSPFPESDPQRQNFQVALRPLLILSYGMATLVGVVNFFTLSPLGNLTIQARAFGLGFVIETVSLLLCIGAMHTAVTPEGLQGKNAWGVTRALNWDEIHAVRPTRVLWLRYLKLSSPARQNVIWVPLFLADMKRFQQTVELFLPSSHPLCQYLAVHS